MSSNIWTRCAGEREIGAIACSALRAVEAQHVIATRKLVDTSEEQELLDELIDTAKPAWPRSVAGKGLHYLLTTPFRYPPLRHGSRFGRRDRRGIWYGSRREETALAEVAYYRLLFLEGSAAKIDRLELELTTFRVRVKSAAGVDLSSPPFSDYRSEVSSPTSYEATQVLGEAMREAGVEIFLWPSARDPRHGPNIGLFSPVPFDGRSPERFASWHCTTTPEGVEFIRRNLRRRETRVFPRQLFLVEGRLPRPAV